MDADQLRAFEQLATSFMKPQSNDEMNKAKEALAIFENQPELTGERALLRVGARAAATHFVACRVCVRACSCAFVRARCVHMRVARGTCCRERACARAKCGRMWTHASDVVFVFVVRCRAVVLSSSRAHSSTEIRAGQRAVKLCAHLRRHMSEQAHQLAVEQFFRSDTRRHTYV